MQSGKTQLYALFETKDTAAAVSSSIHKGWPMMVTCTSRGWPVPHDLVLTGMCPLHPLVPLCLS